jgi:HK97 family phage prohead protease
MSDIERQFKIPLSVLQGLKHATYSHIERQSLEVEFDTRMVEGGDLRVEARGVGRIIRGYGIVFNRLSERLQLSGGFGSFREKIDPAAMDRTLREGIDLRALVDHDSAKILGRMSAGTLRIEKDSQGLRVEIDPPETSTGHDIVASIQRRDVTGMSFAFGTFKDHWDEKTDPPTRTVLDMMVREVSVVTFPAYPQTDVAMRSLVAHRQGTGRTISALREELERRRAAWKGMRP